MGTVELQAEQINLPSSILVVEDDKNILHLLSAYLESAGHHVSITTDGTEGLQSALDGAFDICILDVMLPGKNGVEIATAMREAGCTTPILFLTALGNESDVLSAFSAGADDYMVKPFSPRVLLVRIEAILKRLRVANAGHSTSLELGPITLDTTQPNCQVRGVPVDLTPHEYRILRQLLKRPGQVFSRSSLIACIYGNESAISPKAIDVHVHHLRAKLADERGELIQTVRGFGYKFSLRKSQSVATQP